MINFHRFFLNPFDDRQISFTEILNYAAVQYQRLVANNPGGVLTPRINATSVALTALEAGVSDDFTKLAVQKAKTDAKKAFRESLPAVIAKIHGAVVGAFGPNAPQVMECFPHGRNIFTTCRDEQLNNHLQQLVNCLTPLQAQVGATAVSEAGSALSSWTVLYVAQQQAIGLRSQTIEARDAARAALRLELFKNLLTLALTFPNDTDKCDLYCPQHLLRNAQSPPPPGEATLVSHYAGGLSAPLAAQAEGATAFTFERRLQGETDFSTVAGDVAADGTGSASYTDTLPAPGRYEYRARPFRGDVEGTPSNVVMVAAD
jgi:hypothetical protein